MEKIIKAAIDRGASDLHIKAGDVFRARIDGKLVAMTKQALTPEQTRAIALRLMLERQDPRAHRPDSPTTTARGVRRASADSASTSCGSAASFMIVMRVIPFEVPDVRSSWACRSVLARIAETERGMVLVTGVTGSGKSSTMAARRSATSTSTMEKHIVTLENPIEFLHRDVRSSVTQREIGADTDELQDGTAGGAAPGSRRHHDRRDARRRDDRHGDEGGRDGPPAHVDAAHARRAEHHHAHVAMFPPEEQDVRPHPAGRVAARRGLAAAAAARRRQRPRGRVRGHDRARRRSATSSSTAAHRRDPRLHRRGARAVRHADVRPAPGGPGDARARFVRRGAHRRRRIPRTSNCRCTCSGGDRRTRRPAWSAWNSVPEA